MNIGGTAAASGKVLQTDNYYCAYCNVYGQMCKANIFLGIGLLKNNKTINT